MVGSRPCRLARGQPQSLVNGTVYTVDYTTSSTNPNSKKFTALYTKTYGSPPSLFAAEGYDQANFLLAGIAKALPKVSRASVEKALLALTNRWMSWSAGAKLVTARDEADYRTIALAAPGLPSGRLPNQHAQLFVLNYLVGLLHAATGALIWPLAAPILAYSAGRLT